MNPTASLTSFDAFQKARTAPPAPTVVRVSKRTLRRGREALGLSAVDEPTSDESMAEIDAALTAFAADLRAPRDGHKLVSVSRGGPL